MKLPLTTLLVLLAFSMIQLSAAKSCCCSFHKRGSSSSSSESEENNISTGTPTTNTARSATSKSPISTTTGVCTPTPVGTPCEANSSCTSCYSGTFLFATVCLKNDLGARVCVCAMANESCKGKLCCDGQACPASGICPLSLLRGICLLVDVLINPLGNIGLCAGGACKADPRAAAAFGAGNVGICQ